MLALKDNDLTVASEKDISMMSKGLGLLTVLLLAFPTGPSFALEIQNFKFGLVCELEVELESAEVDLPVEWICFETETVYITGQGRCIYNRQDEHCTWYGYEFDYTGAVEGDEIFCRSASVLLGNLGTPKGVDEEGVTVHEWSYSLPPGDGHHYNPQYSVFGFQDETETVDSDQTVCTFNGEELYRFQYTKVYPALTEKTVKDSIQRIISDRDDAKEE